MATLNLPNVRIESDVRFKVSLTDNGVAVDWSSLTGVRAFAYSDAQRIMAGELEASIDTSDSTILIVNYRTSVPQYLGITRLVIRGMYLTRKKTFDKQVINFVASTAQATGVTVITDPEVNVALSVSEVSTSLLDEAIDACILATAGATAAAAKANAAAVHQPMIAPTTKNWLVWDTTTGAYVDTGIHAEATGIDVRQTTGTSTTAVMSQNAVTLELAAKAAKVSSPVANNFAGLNADGSLKDSGSKASDFESAGAAASAVGAHNSSDSAHATKFAALNTRINNISAVGRFLAGWMSNLGLPLTNPTTMPYSYRSGDYYLVDRVVDTEWPVLHGSHEEHILYPNRGTKTIDDTKYKLYTLYEPEAGAYIRIDTYYWELDEQETQPGVGDTLVSSMEETFTVTSTSVAKNYKPNGSTYNGTASTTEETAEVKVNDMYVYDGTQWMLLHTAADVVMFGNIGGSPYDNGELNGALEQKVTIPDAFEPGNFATMSEEGVLEDSGKQASDFATAAQGALAASAYQKPASGIPEGDLASAVAAKLNDMDVFTATYGTTTYAQVAAAKTAGKEVIVAYSGKVYRLYSIDGSICYFSALFGVTSLMMYLSSTNAWWTGNRTLAERTAQVAVADSVAAQVLSPNTLYVFASRTSDLALSFGTAVSGVECEYKFKLPIGATLPTISGLSGVTWASGSAPSWAVNKTYEVSIVNGVGVFIEY